MQTQEQQKEREFYINFGHDYYKLRLPVFHTIRGVSWCQDLRVGQKRNIKKFGNDFCKAEVICFYPTVVGTLPLAFLTFDVEHPNFTIASKQEFLNFVNKFRRFYPLYIDSDVTVIFLRKILT